MNAAARTEQSNLIWAALAAVHEALGNPDLSQRARTHLHAARDQLEAALVTRASVPDHLPKEF